MHAAPEQDRRTALKEKEEREAWIMAYWEPRGCQLTVVGYQLSVIRGGGG